MEAKLILATVAQHYKLALEPNEEVAAIQMVTLRPKGPVRMRLDRREKSAAQLSTVDSSPLTA
jgi:cytochrome P450